MFLSKNKQTINFNEKAYDILNWTSTVHERLENNPYEL